MKLPKLPTMETQSTSLALCGIDRRAKPQSAVADSYNLEFSGHCHTRGARRAALMLSGAPDQVLHCGEHLFFRYGNTLRKVAANALTNEFAFTGCELTLKPLQPAPDRQLFLQNGCWLVLPDNLQFSPGTDTYTVYGTGAAALPFINPRTLLYTVNQNGATAFDGHMLLKPGYKLRFSWLADETFTVVKIESVDTVSDGLELQYGVQITLDRAVTGWNTLPQTAAATFCNPVVKPILPTFYYGYNHSGTTFRNHTLLLNSAISNRVYFDSPTNWFYVGQVVQISGSSRPENNGTATITDLTDNSLTVDRSFTSCTEAANTELLIQPVIPEFSHAILLDERLIGVDNTQLRLHVSKRGAPAVFYNHVTDATDAWCCNLPAPVTGMTVYKGSIHCFTASGGFKLMGINALNFDTAQLSVSGLPAACAGSLLVMGDALIYQAAHGIVTYTGAAEKHISAAIDPLAEPVLSVGQSANRYYARTASRIWVYEPESAVWWSESVGNAIGLFSAFGRICVLHSNAVYIYDTAPGSVRFRLETSDLSPDTAAAVFPLTALLKLSAYDGCELRVYIKFRGQTTWTAVYGGRPEGKTTLRLSLPKRWCDGYTLRLSGKGQLELESAMLTYRRKSK